MNTGMVKVTNLLTEAESTLGFNFGVRAHRNEDMLHLHLQPASTYLCQELVLATCEPDHSLLYQSPLLLPGKWKYPLLYK